MDGHPLEVGIYSVLDSFKEARYLAQRVKHCTEFAKRYEVYRRRTVFKRLEEVNAVDEASCGKTVLEHHDKPHLVGEQQSFAYASGICRECLRRGSL